MNYFVNFPDVHNKNTFLSIISREVDYNIHFVNKERTRVLLINLPVDIYWKLSSMINDEYPLFKGYFEVQ